MRWSSLLSLLLAAGCDSASTGRPGPDASASRDSGSDVAGEGEGEGERERDASAPLADGGRDAALPDSGPPIVRREDLLARAFNGTSPPADVTAPEFTATAHTGEARTRADLLGRRTVMWFYPAAFTGG